MNIRADVAPEPESIAPEILAIGAGAIVVVALVVGIVLMITRRSRARRGS